MRLIDADDLIAYLNDYARQETSYSGKDNADIHDVIQECIEAVEEQPTAYDIDKAVGRLTEVTYEGGTRIVDITERLIKSSSNRAEITAKILCKLSEYEDLEETQPCGCSGCAFERAEEWEMPCAKCKRNMKDYYRGGSR